MQFDDRYEFTLGDTRFELLSTPGETPDHLTVWIPKYKAAFVGDNYYESFPNIYTLRARSLAALDYVASPTRCSRSSRSCCCRATVSRCAAMPRSRDG